PYRASQELVVVDSNRVERDDTPGYFSWLDFVDMRAQAKSFTQIAGFYNDGATLTGRGAPHQIGGIAATANLLDMLGVAPVMGRSFAPGEDVEGKNHVIILTAEAWKKYTNADPSILGSTLTVDQIPYTVIGILPAGFQLIGGGSPIEYFVPTPR